MSLVSPGSSYRIKLDFGTTRVCYESTPGATLSPKRVIASLKKSLAEIEKTLLREGTTLNVNHVHKTRNRKPRT